MTAPTVPPVSEEPTSARRRIRMPRPTWPSAGVGRLLRQPWLLSLLAAGWVALIGLLLAVVPMLLIWLGSVESGPLESLRLGALLWLVANGAAVTIAGVTVTLLPWGLVLVPLLLAGYAGGWAARRAQASGAGMDGIRTLWLVLPGMLVYAILGAVLASATFEPSSRVDVLHAALGCLVVSGVGLTWGAVRHSGLLERRPLPRVATVTVRAGIAAWATVVGFGAIAVMISLVIGIDDAVAMARGLGAGIGGGVGLLVLGLAYVPVMTTWGASYLLGAGVRLGPEDTVSPFLAVGAPVDLPPFPLLAALPGQAPPMAWLLPLIGVIAGIVAGVMVGRRLRHEPRLVRVAAAGAAAAIAALGLTLCAWLSSGALGTRTLSVVGPDPAVVGVLAAVLVVIGAVPTALAAKAPASATLRVAAVVAAPGASENAGDPEAVADSDDDQR